MPESSASQKSLNWKNILVGVVIGAIVIGLGILVYLLLQPKPEESTPTTTPKTATTSTKQATKTSTSYEEPEYCKNTPASFPRTNQGTDQWATYTDDEKNSPLSLLLVGIMV